MPLFLFRFQILATKRMLGGWAPFRAQASLPLVQANPRVVCSLPAHVRNLTTFALPPAVQGSLK